MKKIFLLLLAIAALFWLLSPQTHTMTLAATSLSTPASAIPLVNISPHSGHDMLEVRIPDADMDYYDVSGNSAMEIRDALKHRHTHGGFDGYTSWHVSWNWPGLGQHNCDLDSAELQTSIRVRLPRWHVPRNADPALILKWNSYLGSLAHHEQGHVQLARQGFAKMQQILQRSTCDEAHAKLNVVLDEMRQADLRYDAETRHGHTQGAKFP